MNFKKLLSAIGLLAIGAPASLSVVACGPVEQNTPVRAERLQEILDEIVEKGLTVKALPTDSTDLAKFLEESIKSTYPENYDGLKFEGDMGDVKKDENDNIISIQADIYITQNEETLAEVTNKTIKFVLS